MKNQIVYSLNIEDFQYVAQQEIERDLTPEEINRVKEIVANKINWYDAVADSIIEIVDHENEILEK